MTDCAHGTIIGKCPQCEAEEKHIVLDGAVLCGVDPQKTLNSAVITEEPPLLMQPVLMTIQMDDFQKIREAMHNILNPVVPYTPKNPEIMRGFAQNIIDSNLLIISKLLDKYEYMEHEGFDRPPLLMEFLFNEIRKECKSVGLISMDTKLDNIGLNGKALCDVVSKVGHSFSIDISSNVNFELFETIGDMHDYLDACINP